jgi:bacillithiol system protein YtxJ
MPFLPLSTESDFERALDHSEREAVVVFKHSSTCPISAGANASVEPLADDVPVYRLIVQQARPASQHIAEATGVRHESPQAIVLQNRQPTFNASHGRVTADALRSALLDS